MNLKLSCARCRFAASNDNLLSGFVECRRNPPQVIFGDDGPCGVAFPALESDLWCGEFAPRING